MAMMTCSGCARIAVNKALKQYEERLGPHIGKSNKDHFIKFWGPPQSTTTVSGGEVCVWRFSYGTRAVASGSQYVVNATAHEMYDKLTMNFNSDGVLQTYRVWCQR
jgi:hypothetical protein